MLSDPFVILRIMSKLSLTNPADPFVGYRNSGLARERGIDGLQELCQIKVIQARGEGFGGA